MKKGFTFMELLGVIVVVGLIAMLTMPVITQNIEKARINTYRSNVQIAIDNAKEYVSKNMDNHDFPENGIDVKILKLKKGDFKSGIIKRDSEGEIFAENIYNGRYCAIGTKQSLIVKRVTSIDDCDLDATGPELTLKVVKITNQSIMVNAYGYDRETEINGYTFKIGNSEKIKKETKKGVYGYEFTGLTAGTTYEIEVEVINDNIKKAEDSSDPEYEEYKNNPNLYITKKKIEVKTSLVGIPKFKISSNGYAASKEVTIKYPTIEGGVNGYKIRYKDGREEEKWNVREEEKIVMTTNGKIEAYVRYEGGEVSNSLNVVGIDDEGPEIVRIENSNTWEQSKVVKVEIVDVGLGIAEKPYSFDDGATWSDKNSKVFTENQVIHFAAKDKLGNITRRDIEVTRIDRVSPTCSLKVVEGLSGLNGWYRGNIIVGFETIDDKARGIDGSLVEGSGVPLGNQEIRLNGIVGRKIEVDGTYVVTAKVIDNAGNEGTCELSGDKAIKRDTVPPVCGEAFGGKTNWTKNQNVIVGRKCNDTLSGCQQSTVTDTISGHGLIENKIVVIKDNAGNEMRCTYPYNKYIDDHKPTCNGAYGGKTTLTRNQSVTVGAYCSEEGPEESLCAYELFTTTISGHGLTEEKEITIRDNVGNAEVCKYTYNKYIDDNPPRCGNAYGGKSYWTGNQTVSVGVGCVEERSGAESGCAQSGFESSVSGNGKTEYKSIVIRDNVGNERVCSNTYNKYIDTVGPTCTWSGESTTWRQSAVITATCNDSDGIGCDSSTSSNTWRYSEDNVEIQTRNLTYSVMDKAGNTNTCSRNVNVYVDTVKPSCSSSGGSTSWKKTNVTITGSCSESSGSRCASPTTVSKIISSEGTTTDSPGSVSDNAGNTAVCPNQTVKIDKTPPAYRIIQGAAMQRHPTLGVMAYKTGEQIRIECYEPESNGSGIPTDLQNKVYTLEQNFPQKYKCKDNAGNETPIELYVVDWPPKCTSSYTSPSGYSGGWTNQSVTIKGTCVSDGSGCNKSTVTNSFTSNTNGSYSPGQVCSSSGAICIQCPSLSVHVDKSAPTYSLYGAGLQTFPGTSTKAYKAGEQIQVTCSDSGGSGIAGNATNVYTLRENFPDYYSCRDNAGNVTPINIYVRNWPPSCSTSYSSPSGYSGGWTNQSVTIKGTCSSTGSGCNRSTVTNSFTSNTNGTYSPGQVCTSSGYPCIQCPSTTVKVDKTPPTYTVYGAAKQRHPIYGDMAYKAGEKVQVTCSDSGGSGIAGKATNVYTLRENFPDYYSCRDNAGNVTRIELFVRNWPSDTTPPSCSIVDGSGLRSCKYSSSSSVQGRATGEDVRVHCYDNGSLIYNNVVKLSGVGRNKTVVTVKDAAGNSTTLKENICANTASSYCGTTSGPCSCPSGYTETGNGRCVKTFTSSSQCKSQCPSSCSEDGSTTPHKFKCFRDKTCSSGSNKTCWHT